MVRRSAGLIMVVALLVLVAAVGTDTPMAAGNATTVFVTNSNDSGTGSFRHAVERASDHSSVGTIVFRVGLAPIALASPVVYDGVQSLDILGAGAVLQGGGFRTLTPGNLSVIALTIRDVGDHGLVYEVPGDASGTKKVSLVGVRILNNGGHGVLVDDQVNPDTPGPPAHRARPGWFRRIARREGARVAVRRERVRRVRSRRPARRRGSRRQPELLGCPQLVPAQRRGRYRARRARPRQCGLRRHRRDVDPGTASFDTTPPIDKDDGMDVDESARRRPHRAGSSASVANDNYEEGFDLNENNAGDFKVDMTLVEASRNGEEGIDLRRGRRFRRRRQPRHRP